MLPEPAARGAFDRAGRWAAGRDGKGTRQLRANLRVVTGGRLPEPELAELTTRALRSYARYWLETFRLPAMDLDDVVERSVAEQPTNRTRAHRPGRATSAGRGVVVALPHAGNWDVAAA